MILSIEIYTYNINIEKQYVHLIIFHLRELKFF